MRSLYARTVCEPELEHWNKLLEQNSRFISSFERYFPGNDRALLRRKIVECAADFTNLCQDQEIPRHDVKEFLACKTIIMSGHQPVIYHPGIFYKQLMLQEAVSRFSWLGINIIVDTDDGAAGRCIYPSRRDGVLALQELNIADGSGPYLFQRLLSEGEIEAHLSIVVNSLADLGFTKEGANVQRSLALYRSQAGRRVAQGNTAVRRSLEGAISYLDVPLSNLLNMLEVQKFFSIFFADAERLFTVYNATLNGFRRERKIKNAANPFPNLRSENGRYELPFWLIDCKARARWPVFAKQGAENIEMFAGDERLALLPRASLNSYVQHLNSNHLIAPRALILTLFMRAASDLFIHGLGGQKYDACTDDFMRAYFACEPPSFCVASGDLYLFEKELEKANARQERVRREREMAFHPEKFINELPLSAEHRQELSCLISEKAGLVEAIKAEKTKGASTKGLTQRVKDLEAKIRALLNPALCEVPAEEETVALHKIYATREFPCFFFC